jgi:hypothetical protein
MPETIHVLVIEHPHGVDVSAHRSNETAYATLAKYCREFWSEAQGRTDLSEEPPPGDKETVEAYFGALEDTAKNEHWEIRAVELED